MANQNHQQPDGLEDHLRRMILTGGPTPTPPVAQNEDHPIQPTVRLPPSASYNQPSHFRGQPGHSHRGSRQAFHNPQPHNPGPNGFAGGPDPNFSQPPVHHGGQQRMQHRGYRGGSHQGFPHAPRNFNNRGPSQRFDSPGPHQQRGRYQQQMQLDPNAFQRSGYERPRVNHGPGQHQLFNPHDARARTWANQREQQNMQQTSYLETVAATEISSVEMSETEYKEKDSFRITLEKVCQEVCEADPERLPKISLEPFGSFKSGFATAGSDMDLVIVVKDNSSTSACFSLLEEDLPRALERRLLQFGYGARLLSRTRVPIIKICEKPAGSLLDKLREEREKWDVLPNEKKYPHLYPTETEVDGDEQEQTTEVAAADPDAVPQVSTKLQQDENAELNGIAIQSKIEETNGTSLEAEQTVVTAVANPEAANGEQPKAKPEDSKPWTRERKAGPLDFPKSGVGIQSDINFFNPLGLHNTQLLRCYAFCDPRVRPMVLFVKAWAKRRKINSSYSGTLSSYGYVLMVLHYLVNVASPPVLPNLQAPYTPFGQPIPGGQDIDGWDVKFWNDEDEIIAAAQRGQLTNNRESLGSLLAGFFHYYSSLGGGVTFRWMQEVLSLRSRGGLVTKEEKGWVKAVTEEGEGKRIQHRYLFCIEDPFELNHNVARTVTHKGIVAIRDEFRRAKRILMQVGNGAVPGDGELFAELWEFEDYQKDAVEQMKANGAGNVVVVDGAVDPAAQNVNQQTTSPRKPRQPRNLSNRPSQPPASAFDVHDSEAFPTLGPAKGPSKKKSPPNTRQYSEKFSEISGDKAQAYLEEVKRKKDEAQMESTAMGAAEAVLGDDF